MKTRKLFAIAIISLVAAMPGCGGDDDDNAANGGSAGRTTGGASARGGAGGTAGKGGAGQTVSGGSVGRGGATQTAAGGTAGSNTAGATNRGGATQTGSGGRSSGGSSSNPGGAGGAGAGGWMQGEAGGGAGGAGGSGGEVAVLTDAEILQIAIVANEGEVAEGEVAVAKASHDTVKTFAQMMIDDHTQAAADARALATASGITPAASAVSAALEAQAQATIAALNSLNQPQFDPAYMAAQVNAHQSVLVLVNEGLLPQADNANLREYLLTMRTAVSTHLTAATQIAADL